MKQSKLVSLERRSEIIDNSGVFGSSYVPSQIYMKEESQEVGRSISKFIKYGLEENVIILGPSGTGKTVTILFIQKEVEDGDRSVDFRYLNCRDSDTSYKVLTELTSLPRGFSQKDAFDKFLKDCKEKTILVLDEADKLQEYDVLYKIPRAGEIDRKFDKKIMLILISNNMKMEEKLDKATRSSLLPKTIQFEQYNSEQLYEILKLRATEGFHEGTYDDKMLKWIAAKTASEAFGDCRISIRCLFNTAYFSEENGEEKISDEYLLPAWDESLKEVEQESLRKLNDNSLTVLKAIIESKSGYSQEVFKTYKHMSTALPMSYRQFQNYLSHLQSQNIILLFKRQEEREIHNVIQLQVSETSINKEYKNRFGIQEEK